MPPAARDPLHPAAICRTLERDDGAEAGVDLLKVVAGFLGTAVVVMLAGTRLARHGDAIAARTRLGGLWVGALFVAVGAWAFWITMPRLALAAAAVWAYRIAHHLLTGPLRPSTAQ